jgi:hypothetical protein
MTTANNIFFIKKITAISLHNILKEKTSKDRKSIVIFYPEYDDIFSQYHHNQDACNAIAKIANKYFGGAHLKVEITETHLIIRPIYYMD